MKIRYRCRLNLVSALILSFCVVISASFAETVVLQPGSEGIDTYICDCAPGYNNPSGPYTHIYQGQKEEYFVRALFKWDISSLPANIYITSATMELWCSRHIGSVYGQMTYFLITSDWEETGVTYDTQPDTSHAITTSCDWPEPASWLSVDLTEFVQGWYDSSVQNYGIYCHSENTGATCYSEFYSSDHYSQAYRPKLTVNYETTGVENRGSNRPEDFCLSRPYPNPFNSSATIEYTLNKASNVSLKIYNLIRQEVAELVNQRQSSGDYSEVWNAGNLPSGMYFVILNVGGKEMRQKMILLK